MTNTEHPLATACLTPVIAVLFLIPLVLFSWNVGLNGAGIVADDIDWMTAFGLSVAFLIASSPFRR